jgi:hypothetical protein
MDDFSLGSSSEDDSSDEDHSSDGKNDKPTLKAFNSHKRKDREDSN